MAPPTRGPVLPLLTGVPGQGSWHPGLAGTNYLSPKSLSPQARRLIDKPKGREGPGRPACHRRPLARGHTGPYHHWIRDSGLAHACRMLGAKWSPPTPVRLCGPPSPVTVFSLYFLLSFSSRFSSGLGKTQSFIRQELRITATGSVNTSRRWLMALHVW